MNMDFSSIKEQVSNLTLYDIKAGVRKVQNAVMNYTEMEAKVREATNNEPWGASSSLMQEIANGTFNYQLLNEIMPMIYKRFTEKAAEEWRQIYKALQLLEFLIKNGSERVIDDARSHLSLLKMLRQFHFIDQNGKDQGINVRNRSKELAELLSDVEKIRSERKKARATRNKYGGVEGGLGASGGFSSGGSRYGGFGSEEGGYGGYSGGVYGDGGGFGGNTSGFSDTQARRDRFEEYDEYDEGAVTSSSHTHRRGESTASTSNIKRETKPVEPPKPKEPEVDLFSFGDDEPAKTSNGKQPVTTSSSNDFGALQGTADDDDFDDFQSATPATSTLPSTTQSQSNFSAAIPPPTSMTSAQTHFAAPQPRVGTQNASFTTLLNTVSPPPPSTMTPSSTTTTSAFSPPPVTQPGFGQPPKPTGYQAAQPNYFTSVPLASSTSASTPVTSTPGVARPPAGGFGAKPVSARAAGGDAFSDLLGGNFGKKNAPQAGKVSLADMAKQKTSAGLWGPPTVTGTGGQGQQKGQQKGGSALDDLLG
ncbi:ENTH-domain-containing protein [Patellaria atrata CBS 101060]|uniref:ENTH-domain-containing protein n=1 Tax=Patellaria atrata CBS 101060 TaxID=1346257 RepID=A0A9P4SDU5_9PEZI|nr:ENTH-domain-containing protein [Patellaria atrata CBS 101060]